MIVPRVDTREQVEAAVQYAYYPPIGRRGAGGEGRYGYERRTPADGVTEVNETTVVVVQVETTEAVERIDDLASVDGLDVICVGPQDLSISLGIPGQYDNPTFIEAVTHVMERVTAAGKVCGMVERDARRFQRWYDAGGRFFADQHRHQPDLPGREGRRGRRPRLQQLDAVAPPDHRAALPQGRDGVSRGGQIRAARGRHAVPGLAEAQVERRHDEEIEQCRCHQATEDDSRHRVLDLVARDRAGPDQRHQSQACGERGHQNRREPLLRALKDQPGPKGHAFVPLQMLEVGDHHDSVSGGDTEYGQEADQGAQGYDAVAEVGSHHTSYERRRQRQEREQPKPERTEGAYRSRKIPKAAAMA